MATYPNVNAVNQYARDVVGGKILACQLTVLACQRHLDDLERAKDPAWPYRFDKNKAERCLRFAQKMPHTAGEWARKKLRIEFEPWQKFALGVPFGWVNKKSGLTPQAKIPSSRQTDNGKQNTYFSSLDNMVAQGNALPVLYGEMLVGSRTISQEISTRDEGGGGQVVIIGR